MRSFAYIAAAVAAVGIAVAVANYPSAEQSSTAVAPAAADVDVASATTVSLPESGSLTLAVPEMHCQYSCFPRVKKALEASPNVEMVELAPQIDPTVLDNHAVVINFNSGFDPDAAIADLAAAGFSDSKVMQ